MTSDTSNASFTFDFANYEAERAELEKEHDVFSWLLS